MDGASVSMNESERPEAGRLRIARGKARLPRWYLAFWHQPAQRRFDRPAAEKRETTGVSMPVRISNPKEFLVGVIFIIVGAGAFLLSQYYEMGSLEQMGPGYFPALVGVMLVGLGIGSVVSGLRTTDTDPIIKLNIEPLALVLAGVLGFAFLVRTAGLVLAIAALIFFACFRRLLSHPVEVVVTYAVLTVFSVLLFVYGVGMVIPIFWWQQ
jgi:hypothetical protein